MPAGLPTSVVSGAAWPTEQGHGVEQKGKFMRAAFKTFLWLLALFFLVWNRGMAQMSNTQLAQIAATEDGLYTGPETPTTQPPKWRQKLQREVAAKTAWEEMDDESRRVAEEEEKAAAASKRNAAANPATAGPTAEKSPAGSSLGRLWTFLTGGLSAYLLAGAALVAMVAAGLYVRHRRRTMTRGPLVLGMVPKSAVLGLRGRDPGIRESRRAA